jgi:dipeptidyl aminopeptidase/acylaminoacyl peptidase
MPMAFRTLFAATIVPVTLAVFCLASANTLGTLGADGTTSPSVQPRIVLRIQPHWIQPHEFWYSVPANGGAEGEKIKEFVWVDAIAKKRLTAPTWEELEKAVGHPLGEASGPAKIEPSETIEDRRIDIQIRNDLDQAVDLFWMDFEGRPRPYGSIQPGGIQSQSTFPGHSWLATDSKRQPLWTSKSMNAGEVLSIRAMELQPSNLLGRRGRGRRASPAGSNPSVPWKVEHADFNLRFIAESGEVALDTSSLGAEAGSEACSYGPDVQWSPNGRYAFTLQTQQGDHRQVTLVESAPRDQLQPRVKTIRYDKPGDRLDQPIPRLFDLEQKRSVPLDTANFPNPWSIEEIRWSEDSGRITFLYNQRGHQTIRWIAVDPSTGKSSVLIDETSATYIDYAAKAYREFFDDSKEVLWGSERDGWYHLYRYSAEDGRLLNQCTHGPWVVRSVEKVDRTRRQIWFFSGGIDPNQDPYYRHLCRVDFDGDHMVQLTRGDGDHQTQFSPANEWLIDTYSRVDLPPVHELRNAETGELVMELERSSTDGLWEGTSRPERFVAKGRDGITDIHGILVRPKNVPPGTKLPVIEDIYAGPQDSFVPKSYSGLQELHRLAELGFVVVKIDGMGTSNRSKAFHDVSYRNLSDGGFPDRKLWIRAAAETFPEMDIERVGIFGGSAGGQNALAAVLFHGDFYDAAVADCGCHDNRMDKVWWNELYMGWPIGEHYESNSNVVNAHRLQGDLMLVVGELDTNVDPASTMQVVDALIRADKDFELLVVPGGGHGIGSSAYGKRRRDGFFKKHLLGIDANHNAEAASSSAGSR